MAPEPQQRGAQRAAAPASARTAGPRTTAPRAAAPRTTAPTRAAVTKTPPSPPGASGPQNPDDFARLVQRNTVDVREQGRTTRAKRKPTVGKIALGLAVVSAAVDASALAVFMGGDTDFAFGICFVVVFLTLIAAVLGFVAAVGSFGRWYGAVGVVVAFFANPVILIVLLVIVAPEVLTDMGGSAVIDTGM